MLDDFAPQTALETELVTRVATLTWRLRRVPDLEMVLVARLEHFQNGSSEYSQAGEDESLPWTMRWGRIATAFLQHDLAQKLGRHEAHLASQLARAIATLRDLQGGGSSSGGTLGAPSGRRRKDRPGAKPREPTVPVAPNHRAASTGLVRWRPRWLFPGKQASVQKRL